MFEGWNADECLRLALYALFGYFAFWLSIIALIVYGCTWVFRHARWVL